MRTSHLPVDDARLFFPPVAQTVEAQLAQQERSLVCDRLEPAEVRFQTFLGFEIDVETHQVEEREPQILGRRIVDIGNETLGIFFFDCPVQAPKVPLYTNGTDPANQLGRNLVAESIAEKSRMLGAATHFGADLRLDVGSLLRVDQITGVLLGRKPDHHPESVFRSNVQ
jgi:hypothetical protein